MKKFLLAALLLASPAVAQQIAPDVVDGCVYNSSLPTLVAGQHAQVQCDNSGRLLLNLSGGSTGGAGAGTPANPLSVASALSAPVALTPSDSVTFTAPKIGVHIDVTVPGYIKVGWANGATATVYFPAIGPYDRAWLINQIFVTGTTATFAAIGQ